MMTTDEYAELAVSRLAETQKRMLPEGIAACHQALASTVIRSHRLVRSMERNAVSARAMVDARSQDLRALHADVVAVHVMLSLGNVSAASAAIARLAFQPPALGDLPELPEPMPPLKAIVIDPAADEEEIFLP